MVWSNAATEGSYQPAWERITDACFTMKECTHGSLGPGAYLILDEQQISNVPVALHVRRQCGRLGKTEIDILQAQLPRPQQPIHGPTAVLKYLCTSVPFFTNAGWWLSTQRRNPK